jgi:D-glucuronyl C5-epimerase C-terminus
MSFSRRLPLLVLTLGALLATGTPVSSAVPRRPATVGAVGFSFTTYGYVPHDVARGSYPYARTTPVARVDAGPHDRSGVRMERVGGRLVDHPVAQASYGLENLESYRITRDPLYLQRAEKQAGRLVTRAVTVGGGRYLPYPFAFELHGLASERLAPPWYSAMAQGQALSLLVRLAEVTGKPGYRTAADGVFASFLRPGPRSGPWTVRVDRSGYLWFEEYAGPHPDRTYNGHMFAAWGVWDYWRLTEDARARQLWDGAVTTVVAYAPTIRNAGRLSSYCLSHPWSATETYHLIHISQLVSLYGMAAGEALARHAEAFLADYPPPAVRGTLRVSAGRRTGYRFDHRGRVTARITVTLHRASSAPTDRRVRIPGRQGFWYHVTAGAFHGYFVGEQGNSVVLRGSYLAVAWTPARHGRLAAGRAVTGYRFSADGTVGGSRTVRPATAAGFGVSRTAHWNAVRHALASDGPLAGYWVPLTAVTFG